MNEAASNKILYYLAALVTALAYYALAYHTERSNFPQLIIIIAALAACSYYIYQQTAQTKGVLWIGIAFRAIVFFAIPFFSQDFYRFIWDGELIAQGVNPYAFTPNELMTNAQIIFTDKALLYENMGSLSAKYNSNYPPVNQIFFAVAAFLGGASLFAKTLILKLFIVLADLGIFFIGKKLLQHFKMEEKRIALYFLNPLVIIEGAGNLHFEALMLFFFLLGIYLLLHKKILQAALFTAVAIATKLVPLMLLPFFMKKMSWKQNLLFFSSLAVIGVAIFYICFGVENIAHYFTTLALWFNNFEFNASVYYLLREIGFAINGYNMIGIFGKVLPVLSVLAILALAIVDYQRKSKNPFPFLSVALAVYLLLSTTVHPWYIITLLGLSIFTNFKFILFWSLSVFISYHAYTAAGFKENSLLLAIEYIPVYVLAFIETKRFYNNLKTATVTER